MPHDNQRFTEQWDAVDPFDPDYPHLWIKAEHLGRYLFAAQYLTDLNVAHVADVGCGTGYGSAELARVVSRVTSIDADPRGLEATQRRIDSGSVTTVQADLSAGALSDEIARVHFDAIVCFETLEHLPDPGSTLAEFRNHLRPGGVLILSVPNGMAERIDRGGLLSNPFHRRMFSISSICEMIRVAGLEVREVLGQPIVAEINRNETRLIRRHQVDGRIGDEPSLHARHLIRRLAMVTAFPEPRDVERSYAIVVVATCPTNSSD